MWDVARKFGRPEDLDAPEIGVRAQLDRTRLDPRLGGLLGDAADAISAWLASDSGIPPSELGRCVAAVAPLVLGTVARVAESLSGPNGAGAGLTIFLADFPPEALEHLDALDANSNPTGRIYRTVFRHASGRAGLGWFAFRFRS